MASLTRFEDADVRLIEYLAQVQSLALDPGVHDCAQLGRGAVLAQTGVDLMADFGTYSSLEGGRLLALTHGAQDHVDYLAQRLPEYDAPIKANAGDLAIVPTGMGDAIGIYQGAWVYVIGATGLALVKRSRAIRAFKVG